MAKSTIFMRACLTGMFFFLVVNINLFAQPMNIPMHDEEYSVHSGMFNGISEQTTKVFSHIAGSSGIPWLSIHFRDYNLGYNSYLIIRSLKDNLWQRHTQETLDQWNGFSAFFNGDAVEIELYAAPGDSKVFFETDWLVAGDYADPLESICGPTDDRIASDDIRVGRLLNVGCTAWIIPNGKLVSAGHCIENAGSANVVEFNVPLSLPGGTIQHPGPEDQYTVISSSRVYVNGGIGNDYGVFAVNPNTVTGLMPAAAQGGNFTLVQSYGGDSIRITGYGVDNGTANQTQQTHVGPNAGSSGNTMRYATDTQGGNSGSPVIDEATNTALGVHTHGGCTSSGGYNNGTSFYHTAFWNAVEQGIPVELVSFKASVDNYNVLLSWTTATETNNKGFYIERKSADDKTWNQVVFIEGNGSTTETSYYSYNDEKLKDGKYLYRLNQTDYDGTHSFSKTVEAVINSIPADFALMQNYPNPFNPTTNISYQLPVNSFVNISVYDVLGNRIATLIDEQQNAGKYNYVLNAGNYASGVYFYTLSTENFTATKRFVLMK